MDAEPGHSSAAVFRRLEEQARNLPRRIALPDAGTDERVLRAAEHVRASGSATPVLVGEPEIIAGLAERTGVKIDGVEIISPAEEVQRCAVQYQQQRSSREPVTLEDACRIALDPLYCASLALGSGRVDGMVAGANVTTAEVLRAAIRCVGLRTGIETASSFFAMAVPPQATGGSRLLLFADCAVVVEPTVEQLADIAIATADTGRKLFSMSPVIAMLSFSTRGSAVHPTVTKMRDAARLVAERRPDLTCDGELQVDAALVSEVAERKAPGSQVAGRANILIFPDLDAGNIGYKLVQRVGNALAIGPILQGLAKPVSDLSRGCSTQDVIDAIHLTAVQVE